MQGTYRDCIGGNVCMVEFLHSSVLLVVCENGRDFDGAHAPDRYTFEGLIGLLPV